MGIAKTWFLLCVWLLLLCLTNSSYTNLIRHVMCKLSFLANYLFVHPFLIIWTFQGRVRILALVVKLFSVSDYVASAVYNSNLLGLLEAEVSNSNDTLATLNILELFYEVSHCLTIFCTVLLLFSGWDSKWRSIWWEFNVHRFLVWHILKWK